MKYKHTITIADIQMNIVTEEEPEVVEAIVGILDRRIREIFLKSENRCPKIEAALLCALDYCAEKNKLQETLNRIEEERRGIDVEAMMAELAELKAQNESLNNKLTYTEDQARTMKNGIDIANDQIRILKTQVEGVETVSAANEALEAKVEELLKTLEEKDAEVKALNLALEAKAEPAAAEEVAEEIAETEEFTVEIVEEEPVSDVVPEKTEEEIVEPAVEEISDKRPVAAIAENVEESFEIEMKPLRRANIDENQLTIDSQLDGEENTPAKNEGKTSVEKEKQKAQKRVRSMFDLITFDNV